METIEEIGLTNPIDLISQAALESQYVKYENKTLVESEAKIKKYGDITVISPIEKLKNSDKTDSDDNYITYDNGKGEGIGLDLYIKNPEDKDFKKISGSSVVTPAKYDPTTNLYTVVKKNVYNTVLYVSQNEKPAGIIEYLVTPMSPQIEGKRYALENLSYHSYVDLSKINTGYCGITAWEFGFINEKEFVLNIAIESYPKSGEKFKDLTLTFIPYNENGRTNDTHTVNYKKDFETDTVTTFYKLKGKLEKSDGDDDNALDFLERNTVYTVEVSYKSVIDETESTIYITKNYWIVTSKKFNDLYPSSEESEYEKNYIEIYSNLVNHNFIAQDADETNMLNAITINPTITITNPEGIEDKISVNVTSQSSDLKGTVLSKNYPTNGIFKMHNEINNTIKSKFVPDIKVEDDQIVGLKLNKGELDLNVSCDINLDVEKKGTEINIEPSEYYNDSYSNLNYKVKLGEENTVITKVSYKSLYKAKSQDKANINFGGIFESFCNKIGNKYNISTKHQVGFSLSSENTDGNQYVFVSKIDNPEARVILDYKHDTTETQTLASGIENKYLRLNFNNISSDYFNDFKDYYFLIGGGSERYEGICGQGGAYYNTNSDITTQDKFENVLNHNEFINGNPIRVWVNDGTNNPILIGTIVIPIKNRTSPNLSIYDIYPKLRKLINDKGLNFKKVYKDGQELSNVYFRDSANQAYVTLNTYNDENINNAKLNFTFKPNGFSLTQHFPIAFQINKNAETKITQEIKLASVIDFSKISKASVENIYVSSVFQQQYYDEEGKTDGRTNEINVEGADYYCIDNNGNLLDKDKIYTQWMTEVGNNVITLHNNIPIFTCLTKGDQKYRYQFSYNYAGYWNEYGQYRISSINFSDIDSVKDISKEDNSCSNEANPSIIV